MPDEIVFDGHGLDDLAAEMRRAAKFVRRETDVAMGAIGREVTARAVANAAAHSKKIPRTIRMIQAPGTVTIRAGADDVPTAVLFELGNRGSKRSEWAFRHPVFGNRDIWVEQSKYPFLRPALAEDRQSTTQQMERVWDRALRNSGVLR